MNPILEIRSSEITPSANAHTQKVIRAAHEFEAVLLNTMLGPIERAFSTLPGDKTKPDTDNYSYLGMQGLSSALASNGGLGIANMIIRQLVKPDTASPPTK